jgi:hypothetical protein
MASTISGQNLLNRNAILFAVVSREHGASQSFICRRLGNNKYSSKKAIVRRIHVDQNGEDIWGGLPLFYYCYASQLSILP